MLPVPELPRPMAVLELDHTKEAPGGLLTKDCTEIRSEAQTESLAMGLIKGVGLMVTEKFIDPLHPLSSEVTDICPEIEAPVLLIGAIQEGILPEPEAPSPIAVFELAQENEAPEGELKKAGITILSPGQIEMLFIVFITGVGLIVIVKVKTPGHSPKLAVTVIVPETGAPVLLAGAVQEGMFPDPEVPSPIAVLELDHVKVEPVGIVEKEGITIIDPGQTVSIENGVIIG
jgi:hypothetical protein